MDMGVGGTIFSSGLVAGPRLLQAFSSEASSSRSTLTRMMKKATLPLCILGLARTLATKQVDYQEHVSEYGTHWNFFYTLATVPIVAHFLVTQLLSPVINNTLLRVSSSSSCGGRSAFRYTAALVIAGTGVVLAVGYEGVLQRIGLQQWMLDPDTKRVDVLSSNREGVFSCVGYIAIYLVAAGLGAVLISGKRGGQSTTHASATATTVNIGPETPGRRSARLALKSSAAVVVEGAPSSLESKDGNFPSSSSPHHTAILGSLFILVAVVLYILLQVVDLPVSRRLCNLSYVVYVCGCALFQLTLLSWVDEKYNNNNNNNTSSSLVYDAVNKHALAVFLVANVLTGAVNLGMDTLAASDWVSAGVLTGYYATVVLMSIALREGHSKLSSPNKKIKQ